MFSPGNDSWLKLKSGPSGKCHFFYLEGGGAPENWGIIYFFLEQKGGSKDFFKSKRGESLILKETKYFVKHFRFQRKGLSDVTRG